MAFSAKYRQTESGSPSGLTAPNENYAVVFVDGTLTILPRSSSGGSNQGDYVIKVITGEGGSLPLSLWRRWRPQG